MSNRFQLLFGTVLVMMTIVTKGAPLPDRLEEMERPWDAPARRLTLKSYIGAVNYFAEKYPDFVTLEIPGRSPLGLPVYLLKFTDKRVPDDDKNIILVTAFHSGAERTGTAGILTFAEWLAGGSELATESLKKNILLLMPIVNPEGFFLVEHWGNSRLMDIYALGRGNRVNLDTQELKNPEDGPEVLAYRAVADQYHPDFHLDVHGTGLHFNGHIQPPSLGRAGSNSSLRSWDDRLIREMIEYGNRAGWGYQQMDVDSQRLIWGPAMGELQRSFCEMGQPYYTSAHYGYFRHHTLPAALESTWCEMVVEPLKGLLEMANRGLTPGPVDGFPVNRIKTNYSLHLEAFGANRADRRESRVRLWQKQRFFLVGSSYPMTANYQLAVAAYGREGLKAMTGTLADSGRWGQIPLDELLKNIEKVDYIDHAAIGRFLKAAPPRMQKVMFEKGDFSATEEVPELDSGLAMVIQLPTTDNDILHLALNGRPLEESATDGYQTWVADGFTYVRVNIPPERTAVEKLFLLSCAWNQKTPSTFGYLPDPEMAAWIEKNLDSTPGGEELKKALQIEAECRAHRDQYFKR